MTAPVVSFQDELAERLGLASPLLVTKVLLLIALVLAPAVLAMIAARAGRTASHVSVATRELLCRFSMSLVPVGVAMWAGHFLFHLSFGWDSVWTPVQRVATDIGWHLANLPGRGPGSPLLGADMVLVLETVLLDAGLLLTLYLAWRIALVYAPRVRDALCLFAPWAGVAIILYAAGVWIFLQPMEMRGLANAISLL